LDPVAQNHASFRPDRVPYAQNETVIPDPPPLAGRRTFGTYWTVRRPSGHGRRISAGSAGEAARWIAGRHAAGLRDESYEM